MSIPLYQVDAFALGPFSGNPAAVCLLDQPRDEKWMQSVAMEMNLAETAFVSHRGSEQNQFDLRWFTPAVEVDLCGHATLASAHVLWETERVPVSLPIRFSTRSGVLGAKRLDDGSVELDFPAELPAACEAPEGLLDAICGKPVAIARNRMDYLLEFESADDVRALDPDCRALKSIDVRGVICTAPGDGGADVVSRFFAPRAGVDEDPVTGSAHCAIGPWWAGKMGKSELRAFQASKRGGQITLRMNGDRVKLAGRAVTVLQGELVNVD